MIEVKIITNGVLGDLGAKFQMMSGIQGQVILQLDRDVRQLIVLGRSSIGHSRTVRLIVGDDLFSRLRIHKREFRRSVEILEVVGMGDGKTAKEGVIPLPHPVQAQAGISPVGKISDLS